MRKALIFAILLVAISSPLFAATSEIEILRTTTDLSMVPTKHARAEGRTLNGVDTGGSCPLIPLTCPTSLARTFTRNCIDLLFGSSAELFTFHGTAGDSIVVTVESTVFPTDAFLFSPTGSYLGSGDYVSNNTDGSIELLTMVLPVTGTYTLEAETLYGTGTWADPFFRPLTGQYRLKMSGCEPGSPPPVANFSFQPSTGIAGQTVQFTDTSTGGPTSWSWTFGDGAGSARQSPSHVFANIGTYNVTLVATNPSGSSTSSRTVTIASPAPTAPVADFTFQPTQVSVGQLVQFTDTSTGAPTSWLWTFGDGSQSNIQNPSHSFSISGTHFVSLKAIGAGGSSTITHSVVVAAAAEARVWIIPAIGSLRGSGTSLFKTAVQLANSSSATISGKIVYHQSGRQGSSSDPSYSYFILPHQVVSLDDFLPAISQSGIGSADIIPSVGECPVAMLRVYNDGGSAGTAGLGEEIVEPGDSRLLDGGSSSLLVVPTDLSRFRYNIGLRTLAEGVVMTVTVRAPGGADVRSTILSYGPNFFQQAEASGLIGPLSPGGSIAIAVNSGSAIMYGVVTDNTTQDPTVQFARRIPVW